MAVLALMMVFLMSHALVLLDILEIHVLKTLMSACHIHVVMVQRVWKIL
jgi:hypothetical protein